MIGLARIFLVFLKVGATGVGGVYSMLGLFQREIVERRGWLSDDEFAEAISIGHMSPGPPVINTGIFIGYRLRGIKGALVATLGQVLPGFFIITFLGVVYLKHRDSAFILPALKGVAASVCGLLLSVVYKMSRSVVLSKTDMSFALAALLLLAVYRFNPIALIAVSGAAGYLLSRLRRPLS